MLRTRENHHDPTSLLFCTLYYLKITPRIRPCLQRRHRLSGSVALVIHIHHLVSNPVPAYSTSPTLVSGGPF